MAQLRPPAPMAKKRHRSIRSADKLETALQRSQQEPEVLILRMRQVLAMDATGLQALEDLAKRLRRAANICCCAERIRNR